MFADYASDLKNPLMKGVKLDGNMVFEKISTVLATALKNYASYCLCTGNNAWMQTSSKHAHRVSATPSGFKCDNCPGDHWMSDCMKEFVDERIAANRKAHGAGPSCFAGGRGCDY